MKNVFEAETVKDLSARIGNLSPDTKALWGKMSPAQMLAHCNVTYEMAFDNIHPKPGAIKRFFLKLFVKKQVVGDRPYPQNGPTAPQFMIKEAKNFDEERQRLQAYIQKTLQLGPQHFDQKESHSFGPLTVAEWNSMFYKHLDHHLRQFGV